MAKQTYGILDGYRGTIGPVIGYQWRGRWCLRARPRRVRNPRTEAQQKHRMLFRDMVQMASRLTTTLRFGLHQASLNKGLTEGNLFVKMNKRLFTSQGVDYMNLAVSSGPVAPVGFGPAMVDDEGVLRVEFEKNPLHLRADGDDEVRVMAYCPELKQSLLSSAVLRRSKRLSMRLPDEWLDHGFHLYGFVTDYQQRASETSYIELTENIDTQNRNDHETATDTYDSNPGQRGLGTTCDGLGVACRREDGDADARRRGAGGSGADDGGGGTDAAAV